MPQTIETTVYKFEELSDAAKATARKWYIGSVLSEIPWYDYIFDDFKEIAKILGIEIGRTDPPRPGERLKEPARDRIWFSGFSCQGDGACFEGTWSHAAHGGRRIREYAPQDATLHDIADRLAAAQKPNFHQLTAKITHRGPYCHEHTMTIEVDRDSPSGQEATDGSADAVESAMRNLAKWLYRRLEAGYSNEQKDESVDEAMLGNSWMFRENGDAFEN